MKLLNLILIPICLIGSINGSAQQVSLNTLYGQNSYMINPASVGQTGCFSAYLNHRNQWVGINNSPLRNRLTLDGRIKPNHGIGLDLSMHQAGLLNDFSAKATYAYHIKLSDNAYLSAGISAGIVQQKFALSDVIASDYSDNTLIQGNQSDLGFTSDAGLLFYTKRVRIGVAVPQVYTTGVGIKNSTGIEEEFKLVNHIIFAASADVISTDQWKLTPSVLYRNAAFVGHQVDGALRVGWKNIIGLSTMYRSNYGFVAIADFNLMDKFSLAYSYGFGTTNNITGVSKGTHEIMLGFKLCKKEKSIKETAPLMEDTILSMDPVIEDSVVQYVTVIKDSLVIDFVDSDTFDIDTIAIDEPEAKPWQIDIDSLNKAFDVDDRMILYELNSSSHIISGNQKKVKFDVIEILKNNPNLSIVIAGHTCDLGSTKQNLEISKKRAADIKQEFITDGIEKSRIITEAFGQEKPRESNSTEALRNLNRRVQISFVRK